MQFASKIRLGSVLLIDYFMLFCVTDRLVILSDSPFDWALSFGCSFFLEYNYLFFALASLNKSTFSQRIA